MARNTYPWPFTPRPEESVRLSYGVVTHEDSCQVIVVNWSVGRVQDLPHHWLTYEAATYDD